MNIIIFGASGKTGRKLITQCLRKGHNVTAFVRNPANMKLWDDNLRIIKGDALNFQNVSDAISGQDVVISALGNRTSQVIWKSNKNISDALNNIILGMNNHKVKRLLFITSFGVNKKIFPLEKLFIRTILWKLFADIPKQEKLIKNSNLNWTIVRPARLVNTDKTGQYKVGENLSIGIFSKISRADVADFLIKNVQNNNLTGKTITISY